MSAEDKIKFHSSNKCWIFDKFFDLGDKKLRDHDHVTGQYRVSTHWNCNVNFKWTKNVP